MMKYTLVYIILLIGSLQSVAQIESTIPISSNMDNESTSLEISLQKSDINEDIEKAIQATIQNYFEGRKKGDVAMLRKAFHPNAELTTTSANGELLIIPLKEYFMVVQKDGPVDCTTEVLSLTYKDAVVTAITLFDYGDKVYIDKLSILKIDGKWGIILKAFSKK